MSGVFGLIGLCLELQEVHIAHAMVGREETKDLLDRLARVSAPNTGVAKVLLVYARLATTACEWIDGDLAIDLVDDRGGTRIEASTELGGGLRERLLAPLRFEAPLAEFSRAITRVPHMIAPLEVCALTPGRIRLSATAIVRRTTIPPPFVAIAAESLFVFAPPGIRVHGDPIADLEPTAVHAATDPAAVELTAAPAAPRKEVPVSAGAADLSADEVDSAWDE